MGKSKSGMAPVPEMVSVLPLKTPVETSQCRQLFSPKSPEVAAVAKLLRMASVSRSGISNSSLSCSIFSLMSFSAISFFRSSSLLADAFTVRPENSPTTRTRHSASESTRFFIVSSSFFVMRVYNRNTCLSKIYHISGKVCNGDFQKKRFGRYILLHLCK